MTTGIVLKCKHTLMLKCRTCRRDYMWDRLDNLYVKREELKDVKDDLLYCSPECERIDKERRSEDQ